MIIETDLPLVDFCGNPISGSVEVVDYGLGWTVSVGGDVQAYLDRVDHRFWLRNPALRERILQQLAAERLV